MKKKVTLASLFSASIILGYLSIAFWFLGYIIAKFLSAKADGKKGIVRSIIIPLGKYELHLHHWLVCFGVGIVGMIKDFYLLSPEIYLGFLGGLVFQGIYCYDDWHRIVRPRR